MIRRSLGMFVGCLWVGACGDSASGDPNDGGSVVSTSETGSPSSAGDDDDAGDGTTTREATDGAGEGEDDTAGDDGSDGGDGPSLGPCAQYVECVMEVAPEAITRAISTYGDEGSCWSLPGVTQENCWTECAAQQRALLEIYPEATSCWECEVDDECQAEGLYCQLDHLCGDDVAHCQNYEFGHYCGHGFLDDLAPACGNDELLPGRCSTEGAFGTCTLPGSGAQMVWYEETQRGSAEILCLSGRGTWTPA